MLNAHPDIYKIRLQLHPVFISIGNTDSNYVQLDIEVQLKAFVSLFVLVG